MLGEKASVDGEMITKRILKWPCAGDHFSSKPISGYLERKGGEKNRRKDVFVRRDRM